MNLTKKFFYRQAMFASTSIVAAWSNDISVARAQAQNDPYGIDVLGFKLGMTSDEIKKKAAETIPNAAFEVQQGTLSMGTYKAPPMVFGAEVSSGRDNHYKAEPNQEFLYFAFWQKEPYKTFWIQRKREYTQDATTTVENMVSALVDKYGQPVVKESRPGDSINLLWSYNSEIKYAKINQPHLTCTLAIGQMGLAWSIFNGTFSNSLDEKLDKCGTWMEITVSRASYNSQLVGRIQIELGDVRAMRQSVLYTVGLLRKGAEGTATDEQSQAARNKPKL